MKAVYAHHTALTGILQRIPPHHTSTLAQIQQELVNSLRPQGQQDEDNDHLRDYINRKQIMRPVAQGSSLFQPENVLTYIEKLDKLLHKLPEAQRPTQQAQVHHIVQGLFDELRMRAPYPLPATVEILRPILLYLESQAKTHNPMLAPQLARPTATYGTLLTGGGGLIPQEQPADPPRGKPHDGGNDAPNATPQQLGNKIDAKIDAKLDERIDSMEARLDTFCTSMQSDNKRKREQEEEKHNDKPRPSAHPSF